MLVLNKFQSNPFCVESGVEPLGSEWSSEALLWFQTLVEGQQLSARVLTVTEQGYGVELQSRGKNVAASLITELLAKASGETSKESPEKMSSITEQETVKQNETRDQTRGQTEASSTEKMREEQTSVASEGELDYELCNENKCTLVLKYCNLCFQQHLFH